MKIKNIITLTIVLAALSSFNTYAMGKEMPELKTATPYTETKTENRNQDFRWTWLNDELCVRFSGAANSKRSDLQTLLNLGFISRWTEKTGDTMDTSEAKKRDTYVGKWSQAEDDTWSFEFEDRTIPVGVTKIDGVLYAFNGFGELKEGYEYYTGQKTGADGIVTCNTPEFNEWLKTQYVPECTTTKTE